MYPYPSQPQVILLQMPPGGVAPITGAPTPGEPLGKAQLKEIKRGIKFYQSILAEQDKKADEKKKKDGDKKNAFKSPAFLVGLTLASPFLGIGYGLLLWKTVTSLF